MSEHPSGPWRDVTTAAQKATSRRQYVWAVTLECGHQTTRALPHHQAAPKRVRCYTCLLEVTS